MSSVTSEIVLDSSQNDSGDHDEINICQIKNSAAIQPNLMSHILQINLAQLTSVKNYDI